MKDQKSKIRTKLIKELKGEHFYIPAYQRGFRWTKLEVNDLLNDLKDFNSENDLKKYCLQPVVVKEREDGSWEVVDGQQRLTTIYIILKYISQDIPIVTVPYTLEYETRNGSKNFLETLDSKCLTRKNDNIDYFHFAQAWETVEGWFLRQTDYADAMMKIYGKIISDVLLIWYQIEDKGDPASVFTQINMGQIPLTSAELIKALFLQRDNFEDEVMGETGASDENLNELIYRKQLTISMQWDSIEQSLRNDEFWLFLTNDEHHYATRIEFLFELIANRKHKELRQSIQLIGNRYFSFYVFDELYKENKENGNTAIKLIKSLWDEVEEMYSTFYEWFKNHRLYHLIGFLIAMNTSTAERIMIDTRSKKKSEIAAYLLDKIRTRITSMGNLEKLTYVNQKNVRSVLLLFNISTIIKSQTPTRFPFDLFKLQKWDIEHIHAINTDLPQTTDGRREWLQIRKSELEFIDPKAAKKIDEYMRNIDTSDTIEFEKFWIDLGRQYGEADIDGLSNLTLLDEETNRSYKNAFFPVKRQRIIERDKGAIFVPVCTKNVFLKLYTPNPDNMIQWSAKDQEKYMEAIKSTIESYREEKKV